jgi:hypothetical protein
VQQCTAHSSLVTLLKATQKTLYTPAAMTNNMNTPSIVVLSLILAQHELCMADAWDRARPQWSRRGWCRLTRMEGHCVLMLLLECRKPHVLYTYRCVLVSSSSVWNVNDCGSFRTLRYMLGQSMMLPDRFNGVQYSIAFAYDTYQDINTFPYFCIFQSCMIHLPHPPHPYIPWYPSTVHPSPPPRPNPASP